MRTRSAGVAADWLVRSGVCAGLWTVLVYFAIMAASPRGPAGVLFSEWLLAIVPGTVVITASAVVFALSGAHRRRIARKITVAVLCCGVPLFPVMWDVLAML